VRDLRLPIILDDDAFLILVVNVVIVIGNEKLYIEMQRTFDQHRDISVVKIPKSGGVGDLILRFSH
jgi:hypothetical protein